MSNDAKIITTLQERRQIDQDIQDMLQVRSQQEFADRAQRVAACGDQVIPVLLRRLDYADARTLSALGTISSLYPQREQILDQLYDAAADLERPDRGRVAAMLILERFFGQEPDPYLISTLSDPQFLATESIKEMIHESERDPRMLLEYAQTLAKQPPETMEGIVGALIQVGQEQAVPVLCLLAQDDQDALGEAALYALGRLNHPQAAQGLQSILPMLSPKRRTLAERSLRKLGLKQIPVQPRPPANDEWRALVSPIDGEGSQIVWFVGLPNEQGLCRFAGFSINDREGIRQVYGHTDVPADTLPARRLRGHVHNVALQAGPRGEGDRSPCEDEHSRRRTARGTGILLHMLEADFDYGRWLVREGQARNVLQDRPVPVEYRLFGPWLWQYDDAGLESSRRRDTSSIGVPRPFSMTGTAGLPRSFGATGTLTETARLLSHPAFRGWFAYGEKVLEHALSALRPSPLIVGAAPDVAPAALALAYFDRAMLERLRVRLTAMSEWLWRSGDVRTAALAALAAETLAETSPAEHPFTRAMIELGLRAAIEQLRHM